ncbi:hypothetical protein FE251_12495 [Georgenia wutianyii]|uniref:Zinc-finger domain-containing protein n=1 Tax=Georgenia wutianyii TaxID=2585135 RepID=A0ABX5VRJ4_9MICO|nr:zf-HC2 domain-containing protein [Georgenia wutianyii]QDB80108.1 hypothetical protein FE251_12495 [Georgenia wutianyii]
MNHLGNRVAPLVDGQLPAAEAEALLGHAAACPRCAWLLAEERASRAVLSGAQDVEPDPGLTERLLALSPGPAEQRRGRRRAFLVGAGVGAATGVAVVGLAVVGGVAETRTDPNALVAAVSGDAGERPTELPEGLGTEEASDEIVAWLAAEGWSTPETLPHGMRVVDVEVFDTELGEVLELELAGAMAHVRVLQQRGVLAPDSDTTALRAELGGGHEAVLLPTGVHDVALQSADCVVVLLSAPDDATFSDAIRGALPAEGYDTSLGARLARGWESVTRWVEG